MRCRWKAGSCPLNHKRLEIEDRAAKIQASFEGPTMKLYYSLASILGSVVILMGCDDKSAAPPPGFTPSAENQPAPTADARPTTQELLNGTYKRISLAPLPLSASAPQSWT